MQIASQVYGIHTAPNGLCFTSKGQVIYITRRFDILPDGSKLLMEDFASIIGKNEQTAGFHILQIAPDTDYYHDYLD
ncbi:MAG: HipA domain-containing protein [Muribaculaceae bacterium]|nr:HipA domain-containing protein [Muribaculaceae bacterium]